MRKLVYIGFSFQHHKNTHAGFNRIVEYLHYDYMISTQQFHDSCCKKPRNIFVRALRHVIWKIFDSPVIPFYLLRCIFLGLTHRNLTFHFVHGENNYYNFSKFIWPQNKIVCTFHQPIVWFKNSKWKGRLSSIDKVTLVSDKELDEFRELTGKDNVSYIPHGISTDFYKPNVGVKKKHMLLTVGNWLRDYQFADKVYHQLLKEDGGWQIVVVSNKENQSVLTPHGNLLFKTGISDDELLQLYLESSVLFLPLKRYTANNSLLEAAACGCNIVIASDASDNSYIPTEMITLCQMKLDETVQAIKNTEKMDFNLRLADYVRNNYSWTQIAQRVKVELDTL